MSPRLYALFPWRCFAESGGFLPFVAGLCSADMCAKHTEVISEPESPAAHGSAGTTVAVAVPVAGQWRARVSVVAAA